MKEHPTPTLLEKEWATKIQPQLIKDLIPVVNRLPRTLSKEKKIFEPQLCMVGESTKGSSVVQLKPTVWVRCGSKRCQAVIKAAVDDLAYLRAFSHGTVHVGIYAPRPAGREAEDSAFFGVQSDTLIVDQLCGNSSACGLRLRIVSSQEPERVSTIGGFIVVNDRSYGMTTAHTLFPDDFTDEETDSASVDSSDDSGEREEGDTDSRGASEDSSSPPEKRSCRTEELHHKTETVGSPRLGPCSYSGYKGDLSGSDVALVDMGLGAQFKLRNEYDSCNARWPILITKWQTEDEKPFVGTVHIVCPFQGVREGFILEGKSLFVQDSAIFKTRKIQLSEPLGKNTKLPPLINDR